MVFGASFAQKRDCPEVAPLIYINRSRSLCCRAPWVEAALAGLLPQLRVGLPCRLLSCWPPCGASAIVLLVMSYCLDAPLLGGGSFVATRGSPLLSAHCSAYCPGCGADSFEGVLNFCVVAKSASGPLACAINRLWLNSARLASPSMALQIWGALSALPSGLGLSLVYGRVVIGRTCGHDIGHVCARCRKDPF